MFGFFKKSKGSAVDGFAKRRPIATTMLCLGALGLSLGGLTTGIVLGTKKGDDAFTNDFVAADPVGEIWNGSSFDKANLQKLFDQISGQSNVGFGTLRSLGNATTTAADMTTNNGGKEIVVTLGDLKWTPTYLSKDNQGNTILTLWLTNSSQLYEKNITSSTTFDANGQSTWSSGWYKNAPEYTYPSNMYGTSYIRTVTLNNGGKYSKSDSSSPSSAADVYTITATQDENSVFAKFTMKSVSDLPDYIVTPKDVQWQEYGQNAVSQLGMSYSLPNENWSDKIPDNGTYEGTTYKFRSYNNAYYNYAGKGADNYAWRDDKIWLPSLTETGYSDTKIGLWNTSTTQRQNSTYSWLRSSSSDNADNAFSLRASGSDYYSTYVRNSRGVRPALHLNLNSAALSAAIEVPPLTWIDYAADKFANETDDGTIDGSTEETAYEIATAEQLALLAKRVNDSATSKDWNTKYYKLTNDIFLAQHEWTPIGTNSGIRFSGSFDGQRHVIYGLKIDASANYQGFFGETSKATIRNLKLHSGVVKSTYPCTGSLVGSIWSGTTTIENVESNVTVIGTTNIGGLVGIIRNTGGGGGGGGTFQSAVANITNCSYNGYVLGNISVGGIVGNGFSGGSRAVLSNCTTNCYVSGSQNVGALAGTSCIISNCVAKGTIDGPGYIFCGTTVNLSIAACSFYGSATHDDLKLLSTMTACWAVVNERRLLSSDLEDPSWTENWAIVEGMNGGLPMQKGLFWVATAVNSTTDDIKQSLKDFTLDVG